MDGAENRKKNKLVYDHKSWVSQQQKREMKSRS